MSTDRRIRNAGLCGLMLLALAAGPALAAESLTVVLGVTTPPLMNTLNLIAEGAGFYKEEGLRVTTRLVPEAVQALKICASGEADVCPTAVEPVVDHYDEGVRVRMFLSRASKYGNVIAVTEESPIKTWADLKGATIGVHTVKGSASVFTAQSALTAAGLRRGDYSMATIGMDKDAMAAITAGKVQAAGLPMYEFIPFMVKGMKLRIFRHPVLADVPNAGYAAAPSVIAARPDALGHFSRAIVKASLLVRYNPKAAARAMLTAQGKPFTDADLQRITAELTAWEDELPAADPGSRRIGAIPQDGIQRYIALLVDAGATKAAMPASDIVTDRFIAFANAFDRQAFETRARSMK